MKSGKNNNPAFVKIPHFFAAICNFVPVQSVRILIIKVDV